MSLSPLRIALQGLRFSPLQIAIQGLLDAGDEPIEPIVFGQGGDGGGRIRLEYMVPRHSKKTRDRRKREELYLLRGRHWS